MAVASIFERAQEDVQNETASVHLLAYREGVIQYAICLAMLSHGVAASTAARDA
jgi:hypothetical protein